jgi:hypothetical protein
MVLRRNGKKFVDIAQIEVKLAEKLDEDAFHHSQTQSVAAWPAVLSQVRACASSGAAW